MYIHVYIHTWCMDRKYNNVYSSLIPVAVEEKTSVSGGGDSPYCAICLTEPKDTVLICGHRLCWDCAQKVDNCPVCRKFVTHRIRLFQ